MKKVIVLVIVSIIGISMFADAQNNRNIRRRGRSSDGGYFYVRVQGGYDFKASPFAVSTSTSTTTGTTTVNHNELSTISLGNATVPALSVGYMFTESVGAELQAGYLLGFAQTVGSTKSTDGTNTSESTATWQAKMIQIAPLFVVQGSISDVVKPYGKFGPVFGFSPSVTTKDNSTATDNGVTNTQSEEHLVNGGWAMGWKGVGGVEFHLSDMFSVYTEFSVLSMAYAPSKDVMTSSTMNGVDQMQFLTTSQKETDYVDSYDTDSNTPANPDAPRKDIKGYYPFSSFGVQAGVKISFGR